VSYYPYHVAVARNVAQALVPAAGCSIEVFTSGTADHKDLFQDVAGQIALANPLTADVDGEVDFFLLPGRIRVVAQIDPAHEEVWEDVVPDADAIAGGAILGFKTNEVVVPITGASVTVPGFLLQDTQGYAVIARVLATVTGTGVTALNVGVAGTGMGNAFTKNGMGITVGTTTGPKDIAINSPFQLSASGDVDVVVSVVGGTATGGTLKLTYFYLDFVTP